MEPFSTKNLEHFFYLLRSLIGLYMMIYNNIYNKNAFYSAFHQEKWPQGALQR